MINQPDSRDQLTGTPETSKTSTGLKTYLKSSKLGVLKDSFLPPLSKKQKNEVESSNLKYLTKTALIILCIIIFVSLEGCTLFDEHNLHWDEHSIPNQPTVVETNQDDEMTDAPSKEFEQSFER